MARRNRPATTAHRPHCIPVVLPRLESDPPLARRRARDPREPPSRAWAASFACLRALFLLLASPNTFGPAHPPLHRALVSLSRHRVPRRHAQSYALLALPRFTSSSRTANASALYSIITREFAPSTITPHRHCVSPARRSLMKGSIESRTRGREIASAAFRKRETKGGEEESVECGVFCIWSHEAFEILQRILHVSFRKCDTKRTTLTS